MKKILNHLRTDWYKYALELIVITAGILGAYALNNWNENRKLFAEELIIIKDIKANLETTLEDFKADSTYNSRSIERYSQIDYFITNDLSYSNELDSAFGELAFWSGPIVTSTAYKSLLAKGIDIIQNPSLKSDIVDMYEVKFRIMEQDYDQSEWQLFQTVVLPFTAKNIRRLHAQSLSLGRPNDFERLKRNEEFKNILSMLIRQRKRGLEFYSDAMKLTTELIIDIQAEIDSRQ